MSHQERRGDGRPSTESIDRSDAGNSDAARRRRRERSDGPDKHTFSITKERADMGLGVQVGLQCGEVDIEGSCLRLTDGKEGASVRPIGLPVLEYLEARRNEEQDAEDYVFPGWEDETPFGAFPRQWTNLLKDTELAGITPHVLRHSFASIGNDLGFTEATIAALVGHSRGTITSRYIHTVDTSLIMAADSIAGYIQGLMDGVAFTHKTYALDRDSRKAALANFLGQASSASNPA